MSNNCNGADSKSGANAAEGLKKGPWTAAEDAILVEYVRKHGEGNWNSVQKNSGLMRCGKSCRLRWANHLRPNLKKGSFSAEEERIIIDLHSKLGNKWARMASHLPGRTDNEIKNFWNTRMKRRQRAGLPIYPQDQETNAVHPQHHPHHLQQKHPNSSSFSSFISSRKPAYNPSLPFLDSIPFSPKFDPLQHHFNSSSFYTNPPLQFKPQFPENNTNNLSLPLSPVPQPLSLSPFNQNFSDQSIPRTPPLLHYSNPEFDNNMSFTSLIMADQQTGFGAIDHLKAELPSNQTPPRPNTPSSGICLSENQGQDLETRCSGLLDALVLESRNLASKEKLTEDLSGILDKGKRKIGEEEEQLNQGSKRVKFSSANSGSASATNHSCDDMTSSQSSIGVKQCEEPMEEMNSMDDDLLSLLDNFPTTTPLPEWYRTRNVGDGISAGDVQEVEAHQDDSAAKPDETPNVEWGLGSFSNLPGLC